MVFSLFQLASRKDLKYRALNLVFSGLGLYMGALTPWSHSSGGDGYFPYCALAFIVSARVITTQKFLEYESTLNDE